MLIDLDNDGSLELICVKSGGPFAHAWGMSHLPFANVTSSLPATTNGNDIVVGDFDNNLRNDMLLLHGALRLSEAITFNGNRIEAQSVNNDCGFSFKSTGVLQVTLDWNKTFTKFSNIKIGRKGVHPAAETFTLDPSDPSTHGVKAPGAGSTASELYIGYNTGTQTWDFASIRVASGSTVIWKSRVRPTSAICPSVESRRSTTRCRPCSCPICRPAWSTAQRPVTSARKFVRERRCRGFRQ